MASKKSGTIVTVQPTESCAEAAKKMSDANVGSAIVLDGDKVCGTVWLARLRRLRAMGFCGSHHEMMPFHDVQRGCHLSVRGGGEGLRFVLDLRNTPHP